MVIVDRLSKYTHFVPLSHPFIIIQVAQAYLDNVYKLNSTPTSIVSNREFFLSLFWSELFKFFGTELKMSLTYHPQIDGQIEVVNRRLETYLQCMARERPKNWSKWLFLAKWWYNTNFHLAIQSTPYKVVYG